MHNVSKIRTEKSLVSLNFQNEERLCRKVRRKFVENDFLLYNCLEIEANVFSRQSVVQWACPSGEDPLDKAGHLAIDMMPQVTEDGNRMLTLCSYPMILFELDK